MSVVVSKDKAVATVYQRLCKDCTVKEKKGEVKIVASCCARNGRKGDDKDKMENCFCVSLLVCEATMEVEKVASDGSKKPAGAAKKRDELAKCPPVGKKKSAAAAGKKRKTGDANDDDDDDDDGGEDGEEKSSVRLRVGGSYRRVVTCEASGLLEFEEVRPVLEQLHDAYHDMLGETFEHSMVEYQGADVGPERTDFHVRFCAAKYSNQGRYALMEVKSPMFCSGGLFKVMTMFDDVFHPGDHGTATFFKFKEKWLESDVKAVKLDEADRDYLKEEGTKLRYQVKDRRFTKHHDYTFRWNKVGHTNAAFLACVDIWVQPAPAYSKRKPAARGNRGPKGPRRGDGAEETSRKTMFHAREIPGGKAVNDGFTAKLPGNVRDFYESRETIYRTGVMSPLNMQLKFECPNFMIAHSNLKLTVESNVVLKLKGDDVVVGKVARNRVNCDGNMVPVYHAGNMMAFDVSGPDGQHDGLEFLRKTMDANFDFTGGTKVIVRDGAYPKIVGTEPGSWKITAGVPMMRRGPNDCVAYVKHKGLAELLGVNARNGLDFRYPDVHGVWTKVKDSVDCYLHDVVGNREEASAFQVEIYPTLMKNLLVLECRCLVEAPHTTLSKVALDELEEHGHMAAVGFMPLEEAGMWLKIIEDVPYLEDGSLDVVSLVVENTKEEKKKYAWKMTSNKDKCVHPEPGKIDPIDKMVPPLKIDGTYVFIPFGQLCIFPADIYHSGAIRTSVTGNQSMQFDIFAAKPGAKKAIANILGKQPEREYLVGRSTVDLTDGSVDILNTANAVAFLQTFVL
jgi:hypothetical protein